MEQTKQKKRPLLRSEWKWAYLFISPMVIGTLIFGIIPIFFSIGLSLMEWDGMGQATFVGLDNFLKIFSDEKLQYELRNTLIYTFTVVPITLVISMGVSNLLNKGLRSTGLFRVIYFLPNIVMPVAVAMVWRWLLNSKVGIVNIVLKALGLPAPNWISDPAYILPSLILISVWSGIGYNAIILLAGLQGISPELYEAAILDGASGMQIFWRITVPLLTPSLFFLSTMNIMNGMRVFDIVYTFVGRADQGGPVVDAARTLVFGIYQRAFTNLNMGDASAEAVVLFVLIMIVTFVQFKLHDKWVLYG